uniref:Uncharacterized protein n=1 Tax=Gorilla gorilla gorilla TaxID=9595 RepID=A0A2I2ZGY3_GORGO
IAPLHSSLGDRARLRLRKKKSKEKCKDVIMWQGVKVKKKTRTSFPLLSHRGQRNGLQTPSSGAKLKRKIPLLSLLF